LSVFDGSPDSIDYHKDHPADIVKALYWFSPELQTLIHEIKYLDASYIATFFGERLGEFYKSAPVSKVDAILPIPLHAVRKRERTYNQSYCIAKGISKQWGIPVLKHTVKRCRSTGTQTKLNKDERRENMKGAFKVTGRKSLPSRICIVDDVFTTGATTMELARTLKAAGVSTITILCLATPPRTKNQHNI
jgi:ComF family protein